MIRIGVSGWSYKSWEASFYPPDLPRRGQLAFLTRRFNSVELNASFYSLRTADNYASWRAISPPGFVFAVKGSRFITHNKKLGGVETPLANFFASGILALGDRLGPILWQLPATLKFDAKRIESFLAILPKTTGEAARLAQRHDARVPHPAPTLRYRNRRIRHALEVRHESFEVPEFVRSLRRHRVAVVFSDAPGWRLLEEVTADFVYARLHGSTRLYASRYEDWELDRWADRINRWSTGRQPEDPARITTLAPPRHKSRDVYVYFDNDQEAHAPHDALRLAARLGVQPLGNTADTNVGER